MQVMRFCIEHPFVDFSVRLELSCSFHLPHAQISVCAQLPAVIREIGCFRMLPCQHFPPSFVFSFLYKPLDVLGEFVLDCVKLVVSCIFTDNRLNVRLCDNHVHINAVPYGELYWVVFKVLCLLHSVSSLNRRLSS